MRRVRGGVQAGVGLAAGFTARRGGRSPLYLRRWQQQRAASLYPIPRFLTDRLLSIFSDAQLDGTHELEKQRLDSFHSVAGGMDRKLLADVAPALDVRGIMFPSAGTDSEEQGAASSLPASVALEMLQAIGAKARERRLALQNEIQQHVERTIDEVADLDEDDEYEYEYVEVDEAEDETADDDTALDVDVDALNDKVLRLRLLEQCCSAIMQVILPLASPLPELADDRGERGERGAAVLASFTDAVTALRAGHGVIVSVPGLLRRVGLSEMGRRRAVERGISSGGTGEGGGESDGPTGFDVDGELLAACLEACVGGGYEDRLATHLEMFRSLRGGNDVDQGSLKWEEVDVVLRLLGEYSALALRDTLLSYETVSMGASSVDTVKDSESDGESSSTPVSPSSDSTAATSTADAGDSSSSSSTLGANELVYSARDAGAVDVDKAVQIAMRQKAVTDYQATQQSADALKAANEAAKTDMPQRDEENAMPVVLRNSIDSEREKEERRWVTRHTKVWLLHDYDHMQKWRCSFAWADKTVPRAVVKNRLDFSGTSVLDGAATPAEIIASQKLNFIELGGFSQHFAAAYKAKRLERHMTIKNNRESMRIGTVFIAACFGFDVAIGWA